MAPLPAYVSVRIDGPSEEDGTFRLTAILDGQHRGGIALMHTDINGLDLETAESMGRLIMGVVGAIISGKRPDGQMSLAEA
jgi:hypothetical protein